jgi:hypothetical protein
MTVSTHNLTSQTVDTFKSLRMKIKDQNYFFLILNRVVFLQSHLIKEHLF